MNDVTHQARRGALAVVAAATLWGTWKLWLVGPALDASAQSGFVLTVSGVIASVLALRGRRSWPDVTRRTWLYLVLFGIAEAVNCGLYFLALSYGDTATAAVTHYLAPVLVAATAPLFGEPVGRRARPAALVAFLATFALVGFSSGSEGTRAAALAGAGSAIFFAGSVFLAKRIAGPLRPWEVVGFHNLIAGPLVWMTSKSAITAAGGRELGLAFVGACVGGVIAMGLYVYGVERIPAARAGILAYLEPVSASLLGAFVFHEAVLPVQLLAMGVIIATGVAVATEPVGAKSEAPVVVAEG